jgi:hypothetical protein
MSYILPVEHAKFYVTLLVLVKSHLKPEVLDPFLSLREELIVDFLVLKPLVIMELPLIEPESDHVPAQVAT